MATGSISFDGNNLQTSTILTSDILHEQIPSKYAPLYTIAHGSGSRIPFTDYTNKVIQIKGKVIATSQSALETALDTFRAYFNGKDKNLDIGYNGTTRRYIATVTALAIDRPGGLAYANYEIEFTATQPFGQDTATSNAMTTVTSQTSATNSYSVTFTGSAPYQFPIITTTISALTGGTNASVSIGNGGTGQVISVTRTWTAADILVIDCLNRTVQVNGLDVSFSGAFPEFTVGAGSLTYSDTLTTRTFSMAVAFYPMYL